MNEYLRFRIHLTRQILSLILLIVIVLNAIRLHSVLKILKPWHSQDIDSKQQTQGHPDMDSSVRLFVYYYAIFYMVWTPMAVLGLLAIPFEQFKFLVTMTILQVIAVVTKLVMFFWPKVGLHFGIVLLEIILMTFLIYFCYLIKLSKRPTSIRLLHAQVLLRL